MLNIQLTLALRYLWGRKLRSILTTLAIVFGTMVIFGMGVMMPTMMKTFQANIMAAAGQVDFTITHKTGEAFSRTILNRLRSVSGVRTIAGSLSRTVNIPENYYGKGKVTALTLTGIDPKAAQSLRNYSVKDGRFIGPDDTSVAVISTSLAETLKIGIGDELHLPTTEGSIDLEIVGLLPARAIPGNEEVLVSLTQAQKLLGLNNRINTIEINLETPNQAERDAIQKDIEDLLGEDYIIGGLSSGTEIMTSMQTGQMAFNFFGFLSLFMGGFIIFNTFRTIVAERRHDIGMLRTIGANRITIIGLILTEGILQGMVGTLTGIVLGYLMGASLIAMLSPMMSQLIHLEMSAPVVQPDLVAVTLAAGVGVTLFAGLLPAFNASRVTPMEALRPPISTTAQNTSRKMTIAGISLILLAALGLFSGNMSLTALGGLMFLIGLILVAPALVTPVTRVFSALIVKAYAREGTGTLAQSNLTRQPTRSAITASAIMIGLAVIVGLGGMIWSLTGGFMDMLQRSLGSDYLIMPPSVAIWKSNVGARQELGKKLRAIPGVAYVSTMRFAASVSNGKSISLLGIDPQIYPNVASLTFQEGNPKTAFAELASERALIANGVFAAQLGLKAGDVIQLSTATGVKPYRIAAIASDYLNAKILTAYISQENLKTDFRKTEDILYQINLSAEADTARVEALINHTLEDYPQFKLVSGRRYFEENKQLFQSVFAFYFVLLGALALPSLIAMLNTLSIGVIERTREIGMLRAIGATQRQVRRMVIAESLLLAAIGTAFGLIAGLYLGYVLVLGLSTFGYPISYAFPYAGLLAAIATGLLFGVLAAILPAHQAAQMEIIQALRYE